MYLIRCIAICFSVFLHLHRDCRNETVSSNTIITTDTIDIYINLIKFTWQWGKKSGAKHLSNAWSSVVDWGKKNNYFAYLWEVSERSRIYCCIIISYSLVGNTIWFRTTPENKVQYNTIRYTIQYYTTWHDTIWYDTVWYDMIWYKMIQ